MYKVLEVKAEANVTVQKTMYTSGVLADCVNFFFRKSLPDRKNLVIVDKIGEIVDTKELVA